MSDKRALGESVPEDAWRRFHKVTPLASGGALGIILVVLVYNILQSVLKDGLADLREVASHITVVVVLIAVGALLALVVFVVLVAWVVWRFQSFAVVDSGIHKRSGIILKSHTHMRWDRVQTVEVEQRLFGRIFGFGSVKVEAAGSEPGIELGLLTMADCAALRKEILRGLANARAGRPIGFSNDAVAPADIAPAEVAPRDSSGEPAAAPGVGEPAGAGAHHEPGFSAAPGEAGAEHGAPGVEPVIPVFDPDDTENDQLIFEMPTARLVASQFLGPTFIATVAATALTLVTSMWLEHTIIAAIFIIGGALFTFVSDSLERYGTKVYISSNGLRVRSGLTTLTTRSMPPTRLHAIELRRPILWRWKDWWSVEATLAGASGLDSSGDSPSSELIIPAGSREEALRVLWTMLPDGGTDDDAALIRDALDGFGTGRFFLSSPDRAKWFDPITYRSRGICLTPKVAVFRRGRFGRRVMFVWQDHTQSMSMSQGPIQRRLGLGAIKLDLVSAASATHKNMDVAEVERMVWIENDLASRARHAGVSESIEAWRERVGV